MPSSRLKSRLAALVKSLGPVLTALDLPLRRPLAPACSVSILALHGIPKALLPKLGALLDHLGRCCNFLTPAQFEAGCGPSGFPPGKHLLLTFDDGERSQLLAARRVLAPREIKAVFFVLARGKPPGCDGPPREKVGGNIYGYYHASQSGGPVWRPLEAEELRELAAQGHEIGAHTFSHACLADLEQRPKRLQKEIAGSGDCLAEMLGRPVRWFAFPFGKGHHIGQLGLDLACRRYPFVVSTVADIITPPHMPAVLPRNSLDLANPLGYLAWAARGGLRWKYRAQGRQLTRRAEVCRLSPGPGAPRP